MECKSGAMSTAGKNPGARHEADVIYGIDNWGQGFFAVSEDGHLTVRPNPTENATIDIHEVVTQLFTEGSRSPLLLRFPQILDAQILKLKSAFDKAIEEFDYSESYQGVFPMKVNPRREVVDRLLETGRSVNLGLEVGSKSELLLALGMKPASDALLICNGFKDPAFMEMAFWAHRLGRNVVIVMEQVREVKEYLRIASDFGCKPLLGLRGRLYTKGSGKWEESGGETSKFGLSTMEMLECIRALREAGIEDSVAMLHFHIGSQITEIRRIKAAVREASRVYAKIRKMGVSIRFLNVGGGLGIDYDGSRSSSDNSANYSVQEFANDVVYTVGGICHDEGVPEPILISESGRALTAYHSILVLSAESRFDPNLDVRATLEPMKKASPLVELTEILDEITVKNFREYYHDAVQQRDELFSLFDLGYLGIEDRAQAEVLFHEICEKALLFAKATKNQSDDFLRLAKALRRKYISNFSVFQSVPDAWTIGQLFPIVPIHRLNESPTEFGILADLTCDSDGKIDNFVDTRRVKTVLELHEVRPGEPYYLGVCLVGAYQEVMGSFHNMFGRVNEAQVTISAEGETETFGLQAGDRIFEVAGIIGYERDLVLDRVARRVDEATASGRIDSESATAFHGQYLAWLNASTYPD